MNSIVALPLAGVPTSSALAGDGLARKPTKEELYAYAEWLSNEHSVLVHELGEPGRFSPVGTAARAFHFPSDDRTWEDVPKPSTRCLSVFAAIGVDASKSDWMARGDASRDPDPVLQLIEDHKRTIAEVDDIIDIVSDLEYALPDDAQKSNFSGWRLTIVPTDDPRWIDITRRYYEGSRRSDEIALQMLSVSPTTLAGVAAMLSYAAQHVDEGLLWPDDLGEIEEGDQEEDCASRDWFFYLNRNLATAVQRLAA
jgi:hypothetical protein